MNEHEKSDGLVVPAKLPNKTGVPVAEAVEGSSPAEGNTDGRTRPGLSAGQGVTSGLDRVRLVARRDKDIRFTALLHHVDLARLWAAFAAINPKATPGVDKVTWETYGQDLRTNLENLLSRVHSGAYRASPSRRVYIPKPDGRLRPLGIAKVTSYCPSCSLLSGFSELALVRAGQARSLDLLARAWHAVVTLRAGFSGRGAWCGGPRG